MRLLLDPEVTAEGNGTASAPVTTPTPDLPKAADALVAKHGDPTAALLVLLGENYKLRDKNRETAAKLPPDGHTVLAPDDAKLFARYKALGEPKAVETALAERDTFRAEAEGFRREKVHGEIASLAGFKPAVLTKLATTDKLELVVVDGKDKLGKPVKVPHVKGDGDETTPLAEYAEKHWSEFLPALRADVKPGAPTGGTPPAYTPPPRPQVTAAADGKQVPRRNVL
jgi:hypothetical protein